MNDKNMVEKIIDIYLSGKPANKINYKELGVSKKDFYKIVEKEVPKFTVNSRSSAWELYEMANSRSAFSRTARISINRLSTYLIELAIEPDEVKSLYEKCGLSLKELTKKVDMPFISENDMHAYVSRNKLKHDIATKERLRLEGIDKFYSNSDKVDKRTEKIKETTFKHYGTTSPILNDDIKRKIINTNKIKYGVSNPGMNEDIKKKIRKSSQLKYGYQNSSQAKILFNKTPYVHTIKESIYITQNSDNLYQFLSSKFPDKRSFTLAEIAEITGRKYSFIKSRFNIDGDMIVSTHEGVFPAIIKNYLKSLGFKEGGDFIVNDRKAIAPLEIDFYFPKQKVGIEVNDIWTHNSTFMPFGKEPKSKNYHMEKSKLAKENGIRLIHAWEHYFNNEQQYKVLQNAIKHALGISKNRVYARNTYVKEVPNVSLKHFFNENNIQGFRGAKTAYALFDKKTDEVLMAYSVGASHFAHNHYDLELIRGASKLDTTIVGGASKLWKFIIDSNPEVNSIVYYIDRNIYNGSSIGSLEGHLELVNTQPGFWNYFVETGEMKNRQPGKHKEIKELISQGKVLEVYNAGTETYVWKR